MTRYSEFETCGANFGKHAIMINPHR